jgi:polysaccharide pyruvyl transferase WcaK-like protein
MIKIVIINVPEPYNRGSMAVVIGCVNGLKKNMPDADVTFLTMHSEIDRKLYRNYDIEILKHPWYKKTNSELITLICASIRVLSAFLNSILYNDFPKANKYLKDPYQEYDIIIDLNVDSLNDHYGITFPLYSLLNLLVAKLIIRKPIVTYGVSIGTFENRLMRSLARFVLNRVNLITVREEITKEYLQTLGINMPSIHLTADHAFLMEPPPFGRINEILKIEGINEDGKPLIGISASELIHKYAFPNINSKEDKYKKYIEVITKAIDYIAEELNSTVILIPHSIASTEDDRIVSKKIYEKVKNKDKTKLVTGEYTADELKGVIGVCDMFIGCRMHSTIASTSMCVPTVALVYGHKSHGIIGKMMGQEKCIIEIGNYDPDEFLSEMKSKIDYVWENRGIIGDELKEKTKIAQEKALLNGKLVKELLNSLDQ